MFYIMSPDNRKCYKNKGLGTHFEFHSVCGLVRIFTSRESANHFARLHNPRCSICSGTTIHNSNEYRNYDQLGRQTKNTNLVQHN